MAKMLNITDIELYLALLKRDGYIEPNLTQGPLDRIVTWAMIERTVPCSYQEYEAIRGFPNVPKR